MSSLSDDTLRKILQQIQNTAQQSSRALAHCKAQIASKERDKRMTQITFGEISALPREGEVKMYKGVGKMFVQVPRRTMENELRTQEKEAAEELANLGKKAKYLEKQLTEAQTQLKDIFHHADKEGS